MCLLICLKRRLMLQFLKLDLMHGAFDSTDVMPIREACHVVVQSITYGNMFKPNNKEKGWVRFLLYR
ncbi:L-arabinokinase isoform X2 [Iris pallida]|uniref:L-arabinokinase isoform X2 n=1 Tax=Iris pallida TaxID=29817 RepID=A0AAX6EKF5_IRIPA|nr:L-arabinokinase isoform X2 [Iris pallida]